ncbi:20179_t:CDS:2 [Dentiscutata erythropus]|uniref:20179_t:CDS:1 n=1 Tax=Dentiscutata erythropus TaxID=1348616 RepID=A0A9N9F8V7_9GLOM|nr:20179_t:CDS:2 [Dentiscutata erythropus]
MTPTLYHSSLQNNIIIMQDMGLHSDLQKGTIEGINNANIFMKKFFIDILNEAGKRRWSSIESCTYKEECLLVEKEDAKKRKICVKKIVKIGIELLEGKEGVLERVLCMDINIMN